MKIGSFNIRGLGSQVKKDEVFSFFTKHELDLCCIQETKMEAFSEVEGRRVWKTAGVMWCYEGSVGRSGGILSFWDDNKIECSSHWTMEGAVIVVGREKASEERFCVINVYALCLDEDQLLLWDRLSLVAEQWADVSVCVIGDFNAIVDARERVGEGRGATSRGSKGFSEFIMNSKLYNVKLLGKSFMCYHSNGKCKSRIDRALVNKKWMKKWRGTSLRGLARSVSDHCPIILTTKETDWGFCPFCFIDAWTSHSGFLEAVENSWNEEGISGWGCYVFKDKLKCLKGALRGWNIGQFGFIDHSIESLRNEIKSLDIIDDTFGLTEDEASRRRESAARLIRHLHNRKSLLAQKAKIKWLLDRDVNSRLFHKVINLRRRKNGIAGLDLEVGWVDDPSHVKNFIREKFRSHFIARR